MFCIGTRKNTNRLFCHHVYHRDSGESSANFLHGKLDEFDKFFQVSVIHTTCYMMKTSGFSLKNVRKMISYLAYSLIRTLSKTITAAMKALTFVLPRTECESFHVTRGCFQFQHRRAMDAEGIYRLDRHHQKNNFQYYYVLSCNISFQRLLKECCLNGGLQNTLQQGIKSPQPHSFVLGSIEKLSSERSWKTTWTFSGRNESGQED